jgi:hypothetical protein
MLIGETEGKVVLHLPLFVGQRRIRRWTSKRQSTTLT